MIELRVHQAEVAPACIKYFRSHKGKHPVIALPTGSGKTYAIAELVKQVTEKWGIKVIVLSHVKEILEQNHKSLEKYLGREVSLNSSMLGRREVGDITVAGIQSVYRNPGLFKEHKLVVVDEAHLINTDEGTMYQKFLSGIGKYICVGFTATPFRLGSGYIYSNEPDTMFDDCIVDWTSTDKFNKLISLGYLSPLITKRTKLEMDTSGIRLVGGDFSEKQLSERFDRLEVTNQAIKEIIAAGANRKKWVIFAIDIDHAEHIAEILIRNGIPTAPVHSRMSDSGFDRADTIDNFQNGKYRCVVNVNILTTGFDEPGIDLIGVLRPTSSPVLHVQIAGRGSRVEDGKENCLILDFAGNTARLGPVNDVVVKKVRKGEGTGEPITKACPDCNSIVAPVVKICPDCGHEFKFQHGLSANASTIAIIEDGTPKWLHVDDITYHVNRKIGVPSSIKVEYKSGSVSIAEWICIEHKGFAKHKADHWVKYRGGEVCNSVDDFIEQIDSLKKPKEILVSKKGKYFNINNSKF